jgi:hypothetical protein
VQTAGGEKGGHAADIMRRAHRVDVETLPAAGDAPFRPFARAPCGTIRRKLLKIGAMERVSVRRIKIAVSSAFPHQNEFAAAWRALGPAAA